MNIFFGKIIIDMIILWKQKKDVLFLEGKYLFDGRKIKYMYITTSNKKRDRYGQS